MNCQVHIVEHFYFSLMKEPNQQDHSINLLQCCWNVLHFLTCNTNFKSLDLSPLLIKKQIPTEIMNLPPHLLPNNIISQCKPGDLAGNNTNIYFNFKCFYCLPNFPQPGYSINFPTNNKETTREGNELRNQERRECNNGEASLWETVKL